MLRSFVVVVVVGAAGCGQEAPTCWIDVTPSTDQTLLYVARDCGARGRGLHSFNHLDGGHRFFGVGATRIAETVDGTHLAISTGDNQGIQIVEVESGDVMASTGRLGFNMGDLAFTPDGTGLWITHWGVRGASTIALYETANLRRKVVIPLAGDPLGLALDPSGAQLLVAPSDPGMTTIFDAPRFTATAERETAGALGVILTSSAAIVLYDQAGQVVVHDSTTLEPRATYPVGNDARSIAATDEILCVAERRGRLRVFDLRTELELMSVQLDGPAENVALSNDGSTAFVGLGHENGSVVSVELSTGEATEVVRF